MLSRASGLGVFHYTYTTIPLFDVLVVQLFKLTLVHFNSQFLLSLLRNYPERSNSECGAKIANTGTSECEIDMPGRARRRMRIMKIHDQFYLLTESLGRGSNKPHKGLLHEAEHVRNIGSFRPCRCEIMELSASYMIRAVWKMVSMSNTRTKLCIKA